MSSEQRLHPYTILFAFLTQIRIFLLPGIFLMLGIGSWGSEWGPRGGDWWQPWMMIFIVPAAAAAVVRYLTYRYRYEENELVIRSGLLFRKERHIPYARIQNIDAEQNILHRLLNVIEIKIETGGGRSRRWPRCADVCLRSARRRLPVALDLPVTRPVRVIRSRDLRRPCRMTRQRPRRRCYSWVSRTCCSAGSSRTAGRC
jgi:uncharacterized membrane protein YdbT with pleckstrin-like domain